MLELRCAVSTSDELLVDGCVFVGCSRSYDLGLCINCCMGCMDMYYSAQWF